MIHDDGRNFLNLTDRNYDLITSEPPPPIHDGVYRLYSKEYYEAVLAHLTPQGLMTQWLPLRQMPPPAVDLAISTFVSVFPDTLLFVGSDEDFILLGSKSKIDLRNLEKRFDQSNRAGQDLRGILVPQSVNLITRIVKSDHTLRDQYQGHPVVSDLRNDFAYLFNDPTRAAVITYNPLAVLQDIEALSLKNSARINRILTNFGLLRTEVQDFPVATLMSVPQEVRKHVAHADADWKTIHQLNIAALRANKQSNTKEAISLFQRSLQLVPDQANILRALAGLQMGTRQIESALSTWKGYQALEPDIAVGHYKVGQMLVLLKRYQASIRHLRRAGELQPNDPRSYKLLGNVYSELGKYPEAIEAFQHALTIAPQYEAAKKGLRLAREALKLNGG